MNSTSFIHVICWLVQNSQKLMDTDNLYQQITSQLWPDTKIRMQRWKATLGELESNMRTDLHKQTDIRDPQWQCFFSLAHEILLSESLTRVLFAVIATKTKCPDVRDIAADVVTDNLQIRKRVLTILETAPVVLKRDYEKVLELKVLNEHITDLMLSQLPDRIVGRKFAINETGFDEFVKCAGAYQKDVIRQANVALNLAFSNGIQDLANPIYFNEDINLKIVNGIASLFIGDTADFPFPSSVPMATAV